MAEAFDPEARLAALKTPAAYAQAKLECDVVMKGGITSGVIYPPAVCELATVYRFRNVGGTSAGAIAAAVAAAAERGRRTGKGTGFAGLAELPEWLGGHLEDLFEPAREHRAVFRLLSTFIRKRRRLAAVRRFLATLAQLLRAGLWNPLFPVALVFAVPGVALLLTQTLTPWARALVGLTTSGALVAGCIVSSFLLLALRLPHTLYGMVTGSGTTRRPEPPLTDWLHERLNRLAGKDPHGPPLTFEELWKAPRRGGDDGERSIHLEVLTTCLSLGRAFRLPDDFPNKTGDPLRALFFSPREFRRLFPEPVVEHMLSHPPKKPGGKRAKEKWNHFCEYLKPLRPLPDPGKLPVVVAVRMSLSFPLLISAVPLYQVDETLKRNRQAWAKIANGEPGEVDPEKAMVAEHCWFSDGGITSNFPVHIFDTLLPIRPTFGINLRPFHPDHSLSEDPRENVWMPEGNAGGISEWWYRDEQGRGIRNVQRFLGALLNTMQNWRDNEMLRIPGFRDRLVHVHHTEAEGGMNLSMPEDVISALSARGLCAGARLRDSYTQPPTNQRTVSWINHRWVRMRTALAMLEETMGTLEKTYSLKDPLLQASYRDLLHEYERAPSYRRSLTKKQYDTVVKALEGASAKGGALAAMAAWRRAVENDANTSLRRNAPRPVSELRVMPGSDRAT